jgi:hypothetical protein
LDLAVEPVDDYAEGLPIRRGLDIELECYVAVRGQEKAPVRTTDDLPLGARFDGEIGPVAPGAIRGADRASSARGQDDVRDRAPRRRAFLQELVECAGGQATSTSSVYDFPALVELQNLAR